MKIKGRHYRTIWVKENEPEVVQTIDQRLLPFKFEIIDLRLPEDFEIAIREMIVRGAPLIGVTAAYCLYSATLSRNTRYDIQRVSESLKKTRPTAVDLFNAIERMTKAINASNDPEEKSDIALSLANQMAEESIKGCRKIGEYGLEIIKKISEKKKGEAVNILTHCNAGWLAFVDYGTATAPIYFAQQQGIDVHVWVDETRPRNQGSQLTAWEFAESGIAHTLIVDNAGGHLMQHDEVDIVITPPMIWTGAHQTVAVASGVTALDGKEVSFVGTASTAYKQNMLFHKNAFTIAVVPMVSPPGAVDVARESQDGINVRLIPYYDGTNDYSNYRLDVLYGRKTIDGRLATRLSGTA